MQVRDTGPGIEKDRQLTLFKDSDNPLSLQTLQNEQGIGPGLFVSSQIVRHHGGQIGVSSEGPGLGSTFFIELPVISASFVSYTTNPGALTPHLNTE
jgi:signal transduction histidine kinase